MKLVVVYNKKSGSGFGKSELNRMMHAATIEVEDWIPISQQMERHLKPHIIAGMTIAVVGGDGTQRAVASLLVGTKATMAPLPGGTLNHFTKDLGVPQDMNDAIGCLSKLKPKQIDTAVVNDETFINNSSIGLYPHSLLEREKTEKFLGKCPAAMRAGVRTLVRFRRYRLTINGQSLRTPFVFVGNNHYEFESSLLAERTSLVKGHLTLFVLRSKSRISMARAALFDRLDTKKRTDEFTIDHPSKLTIESEWPLLAISLDGEVMRLETPLRYEIKSKSLKVLV